MLGGLLTIIGLIYISVGWSWLVYTTPTRIQGVEWLPLAIHTDHVGWWWIAGGALTVFGGLLSRHRWVETTAVVVGVGTSASVATIFLSAWVAGASPGGLITAVTYGGWAAVVAWVSTRTALNALRATPVRGEARD